MNEGSSPAVWDCIVVGAGVVGSCTAYQLAKQGYRTLVLEQFPLPHTRGSSHGPSRILNNTAFDPAFRSMPKDSLHLWQEIQKETKVKLLHMKETLWIQEPGCSQGVGSQIDLTIPDNHHVVKISADEVKQQYPMFANLPVNGHSIVMKESCVLFSDQCLKALRAMITKYGGKIHDAEPVTMISPERSKVTVITTKSSYRAKKIVLAAGSWINDVLRITGDGTQELPVKTMPGRIFYFRTNTPEKHSIEANYPIFTYHMDTRGEIKNRHLYSLPVAEYPGMIKIATRGEPPSRYCHPNDRDAEGASDMQEILKDFIQKHMPGVDPTPSIAEPCMYTMSSDKIFILDYHPAYKNIILASGFSGSGFGLSPAVGKLLSEMATDQKLTYNQQPFSLARFKETKSKL